MAFKVFKIGLLDSCFCFENSVGLGFVHFPPSLLVDSWKLTDVPVDKVVDTTSGLGPVHFPPSLSVGVRVPGCKSSF